MRALRLHRDRARRRVLEGSAPVIDSEVRERDRRMRPERAVVAHEDDIVIGEFVVLVSGGAGAAGGGETLSACEGADRVSAAHR
jgi:hypothetical protein